MHLTLAAVLASTLLLATPHAAADDDQERFDGHKVVRTVLTNRRHLKEMLDISPDVWSHRIGLGEMDFRIPPDRMDDLDDSGIPYVVLIDDLQELIDAQDGGNRGFNPGGSWFSAYKTYDEHMAYLDELDAVNPDLTEVFTIGQSLEGRDIKGIRIGNPDGPTVILQGGQHAREWISPMVVQFTADHLIRNYGIDDEVTRLLNNVEFIVVPTMNPDGYIYTWTTNRMWRKNRRGGYGVDLNRNWSWGWGGNGSSGDQNSQTYRGPSPFSEPETTVMADFIANESNVAIHLDIHSYSQLIMWPWGDTQSPPADEDELRFLSEGMAAAILSVHGKVFRTGQIAVILYEAAGNSTDWVYGDQEELSIAYELRDTGQFGFVLPPDQIIPSGEEFVPAMLFLADQFIPPLLGFEFPDGQPQFVSSGGGTTMRVNVTPLAGTPQPGTGILHVDRGSGFEEFPMEEVQDNQYLGVFPSSTCGDEIRYYVSAETTNGDEVTSPSDAPASAYSATSGTDGGVAFDDDFESDTGWTVESVNLTDGEWGRGVPANGNRGDPPADHDGSGRCYVTDNVAGNSDVDGGPTILTSPRLELGDGAEYTVSYARWFHNSNNGNRDFLDVQISNDDGATWTTVERVTDNGSGNSWVEREFVVSEFVSATNQVRVRFVTQDQPNDSIVEAGVDAFRVYSIACEEIANLTDLAVVEGTITVGGLDDLRVSDDQVLRIEARVTGEVAEPHRLDAVVGAETGIDAPTRITLTLEASASDIEIITSIQLYNWNNSSYVEVDSYSIGMEESVHVTEVTTNPGRFVRAGDGRIQVRVFQVNLLPFTLGGYIGSFDHLGIAVQ